MKQEEIKLIIKETVEEAVPAAVQETFVRLGMDVTDPLECQKDFAYLRGARKVSKRIIAKALTALVGAGAGGSLIAWLSSLS